MKRCSRFRVPICRNYPYLAATALTRQAARPGLLADLGEDFVYLVPRGLGAGWLEIAHGAGQVRVTHPRLQRAKIYVLPEAPGAERGAELVQPEVIRL